MLNHKYKFKQNQKRKPILEALLVLLCLKVTFSLLLLNSGYLENLENNSTATVKFSNVTAVNKTPLAGFKLKPLPFIEPSYTLIPFQESEILGAAVNLLGELNFNSDFLLTSKEGLSSEKLILISEIDNNYSLNNNLSKISFSPSNNKKTNYENIEINLTGNNSKAQLLELKEKMLLELEAQVKEELQQIASEKKELEFLINKNQEILNKITVVQHTKVSSLRFSPNIEF